MKIELRTIKIAAFASQETHCFKATVYIDSVKAGEVGNEGHGGCNRYWPHGLEERLEAYAKTLPNIPSEYFPEGLEMCADILIGDLLTEHLLARDLTRLLKTKLVFAKGGKILATKKLPAEQLAFLVGDAAATRAKYKADAILNALPFADALALYKGSAAG